MRRAHGWLRRNRFGLILLPVALVALVAGNGQRLHDYWWLHGQRVATSATERRWVHYRESYTDALGSGQHDVEVRVDKVVPVREVTDLVGSKVRLTTSLGAYAVTMSFRAEPDVVLSGCSLALVDDHGERHDFRNDADGILQDVWPCVPGATPGPSQSIRVGTPRTDNDPTHAARPAQWTTTAVIFAPTGLHFTQARLWWSDPHYLRVALR